MDKCLKNNLYYKLYYIFNRDNFVLILIYINILMLIKNMIKIIIKNIYGRIKIFIGIECFYIEIFILFYIYNLKNFYC